jgi:hypothetical protein
VADVDAIRRRASADPPDIENLAHGCFPLHPGGPVRLGGAVLLLECRDRGFELGRDPGALATVQTAAQLGAEFFDVVLKRDHRPLLLFEDGRGGPRRVEDRASDRQSRRAGEPILSRATLPGDLNCRGLVTGLTHHELSSWDMQILLRRQF